MAKKTTTTQKLDADSKTPDQLHQEWLRCLEESALAKNELDDGTFPCHDCDGTGDRAIQLKRKAERRARLAAPAGV